MRTSLFESLKCITKTKTLMFVHPAWTSGLVILAVFLTIGAAALSKRLGLPDQPQADDLTGILQRGLLNLAVLFPLELYFIPRWILATDAFTPGESKTSKETWKQLFEERWGKVFFARILIAVVSSIGFMLCLVPGFLILMYFGWTPWRVLLQGESISVAAKTSARNMALLWPQTIMAVAAILLILLAGNELAHQASALFEDRIGWHFSNAFSQLSIIWMNAALLGLYQWMESTVAKIKLKMP